MNYKENKERKRKTKLWPLEKRQKLSSVPAVSVPRLMENRSPRWSCRGAGGQVLFTSILTVTLLSYVSRGLGKTASLIRIYAAVYSLDGVARISASHIILRNSKLKHGFGVYVKCKGF